MSFMFFTESVLKKIYEQEAWLQQEKDLISALTSVHD